MISSVSVSVPAGECLTAHSVSLRVSVALLSRYLCAGDETSVGVEKEAEDGRDSCDVDIRNRYCATRTGGYKKKRKSFAPSSSQPLFSLSGSPSRALWPNEYCGARDERGAAFCIT